jgi:hypothetical protein
VPLGIVLDAAAEQDVGAGDEELLGDAGLEPADSVR